MTLVNIDLKNAGYETGPDDRVVFYSPANRNEQGTIISTAETSVPLVDGQASKELAPGPVVVQILAQGVADTRPKSGYVPDEGPVSLWDVVLDWTPALVDQGILTILTATDTAVGEVAGAVDAAIEGQLSSKVDHDDPRVPKLAEVEGYLGVLVDANGTPTDLAIRSSDGQLAEWVVQRLAPRIGEYLGSLSDADVLGLISASPQVPRIQETPGYLGVLVDADGTPTDLAIRSSDGQLAEWVVKRLAPRIQQYLSASGGGQDLTRFPLMAARLAVNREAGNPSNFVFLGSSTTASSLPTSYVARVVAGLQARYPSGLGTETAVQANPSSLWDTIHTTPGIHGYNGGEGGTTSGNYLRDARVDRITPLEPVVVMHMAGENDLLYSTPYDEYQANIESWIDKIDAGTTQPVQHILVHKYPRWGEAVAGPSPDHYQLPWDGYRDALMRIAMSRTNVGFIDTAAAFYDAGVDGQGGDPLDLISADDTHANPSGQGLIADLILEALTNIL